MIRDLKAVIAWLPGSERWRWLALVPVAVIAALVEAAGALAVFGLLRLVVDPDLVRTAPVVSAVWRWWPTDDTRAIVAVLTLVVAAFYVLRAAFLSYADWMRNGVIFRSAALAGERLLARYLAADYPFHARRRSASLIEPVSRAADMAYELCAGSAINILAEVAIILALTGVVVASAPAVTLVTVAIVLGAVTIPIVLMRKRWTQIGETESELHQRQLHLLQQSLGAVKDVIVTGRQAYFEGRFRQLKRELAQTKQHRAWAAAHARLIVEAVLILCMLLVVFLVLRERAPGGNIVSVLALFAYTGFRIVPSANRIMLNVGYMREAHPFVRQLDDDMRHLRVPASRPFAHNRSMLQRGLRCDNVSFRYEDGTPALDSISFTIERGQSIGVVGPTGAGKSTLVDVLLGLLTPTSGQVLIDDEPLEGHEREWQRQIGYVSQEVYLLDDSLRRNVAFGIPDAAIDESRLSAAVEQARLTDVVAGLPNGLDTVLGENGVRLSGGQRQRVAIARALYHDPPVLCFDEATAALDNQTEREVTEAIANVHGTRTVIAIAHRLSTVKNCDRLIYLRDGRVAGQGTYQELLADPEFRRLT